MQLGIDSVIPRTFVSLTVLLPPFSFFNPILVTLLTSTGLVADSRVLKGVMKSYSSGSAARLGQLQERTLTGPHVSLNKCSFLLLNSYFWQ